MRGILDIELRNLNLKEKYIFKQRGFLKYDNVLFVFYYL